MAYGIEVYNASGREIFSTENYSTFYATTPTTVTGYYNAIPTLATGEILIARPPNNTSAVMSLEYSGSPLQYYTLGSNTFMQTFAVNPGYKYSILKRTTDLSPSTSGYGMEVYNDASPQKVIFSSNSSRVAEILAYGELPDSGFFNYESTGTFAFNDIYIVLDYTMLYINILGSDVVTGAWAYFDHTNERIQIRKTTLSNVGTSTQIQYFHQDSSTGINQLITGVGKINFMIMGMRG